jgi:hypothetical protein
MEEQEEKMDEDGYSIGDPYAGAAKMVDKL